MIYYSCPDLKVKSGGLRRIYSHVDILNHHGIPAFVLHNKTGFKCQDMPAVPIRFLDQAGVLKAGDIIVIPGANTQFMNAVKHTPLRRFVLALGWRAIFHHLADGQNWQDFNIERVITVSPFISDYVAWSMRLPVHTLAFSVNPDIYFNSPEQKINQIAFFKSKSAGIDRLYRSLISRNPDFGRKINWKALHDLTEQEYAEEMRKSTVFLALAMDEGLNRTVFEAMACGTIVAGFHGIGLQHIMVGKGDRQNCLLAHNGDIVTLAYLLEPLLLDILAGNLKPWTHVAGNGLALTSQHTPDQEEHSILAFWNNVLSTSPSVPR